MAPAGDDQSEHAIEIHLDKLLADRGMTLTQLSELVGVTIVNLSILKNGRAKAIRFSTLTRLCEVLGCQPGDLMSWRREGGQEVQASARSLRVSASSWGRTRV